MSENPVRFVVVGWRSLLPLIERAGRSWKVDVRTFSTREVEKNPGVVERVLDAVDQADLVLLHRTADSFWTVLDEGLDRLAGRPPIVCVGGDPSFWRSFNTPLSIGVEAQRYFEHPSKANIHAVVAFLLSRGLGHSMRVPSPAPLPWEGIHHPDHPEAFEDTHSFLEWYGHRGRPLVGVLTYRQHWITGQLSVENRLVRELEARGLGVVPVFYYSLADAGLGSPGGAHAVRKYLTRDNRSLVRAVVKLNSFPLSSQSPMPESVARGQVPGPQILSTLGVPVFQPILCSTKTQAEWESDPLGLGSEIGWSITMPEIEGVIEPIIVSTASSEGEDLIPLEDRVSRLGARVARWVTLSLKPPAERRVAFVLNSDPCSSLEATVGSAAKLEALESVARILESMERRGYRVDGRPLDGETLVQEIVERKAFPEFRFTTVSQTLARGGALDTVSFETYRQWLRELPEPAANRMVESWGEPGGETGGDPGCDGHGNSPIGMTHENGFVIAGLRWGNAVILVQPKRGCVGSRCDGHVCKILHDPSVPPPHHYLATYRYLERVFHADVVVHVGTHGTLEFLPGKSVALSSACFPDLVAGDLPFLYIYNADNPAEAVTAKRRGLSTLVDHLQTVMLPSGLYGDLEELDRLLAEWREVRGRDRSREHQLEHSIGERLAATGLDRVIETPPDAPFEERVAETHDRLTLIQDSWVRDGLHVFGGPPDGQRREEFLLGVLAHDEGPSGLRGLSERVLEESGELPADPSRRTGAIIKKAQTLMSGFLTTPAQGLVPRGQDRGPDDSGFDERVASLESKILDVAHRLDGSDEMGALLTGLEAGFIRPGPAGIVTRGRDDVLPTGRNCYTLDPKRLPTRAATEIGRRLADEVIAKHLREEGRIPEGVAIYWQANDLLWADGEGLACMMALIGVEPTWGPGGRVHRFRLVPQEELKRPRIDLTVRMSGILRDNFPDAVALLDRAIREVAQLPEPEELNLVRRNALAHMALTNADSSSSMAWRQATFRIFSSAPGTYQAGTQLAVASSAWKSDSDLSDVFLHWNGYAYGENSQGEPAHANLKECLTRVDLTFNKVVTDESDLLGCCGYYGAHGGMTMAARVLSGRDVKSYYGDTRHSDRVSVRDLAQEIDRVVRVSLLHPRWIEGMKRHGYRGAGDIAKTVGRVYGWEATARAVDDGLFDAIGRAFVLNPENREFFRKENPWALEEIARRLKEAAVRGLWKPAPDVSEALDGLYLEIEGWIEETMDEVEEEFQGGSVDIVTKEEVDGWKTRMQAALGKR